MKLKKAIILLSLNLLLISCDGEFDNSISIIGTDEIRIGPPETVIQKQNTYLSIDEEIIKKSNEDDNVTRHDFFTNTTSFKKIDLESTSTPVNKVNEVTDSTSSSYTTKSEDTTTFEGLIKSTFYNVKTSSDPSTYSTYIFYSPAFLLNKDIVFANSNSILKNFDINDKNDYRFADKVEIYYNYNYDEIGSYINYEKKVNATSVYIDKSTYDDVENKHDFAILTIDEELSDYNYDFNILTNWYADNMESSNKICMFGVMQTSDSYHASHISPSLMKAMTITGNYSADTREVMNLLDGGNFEGGALVFFDDNDVINLCGFVTEDINNSIKKFKDIDAFMLNIAREAVKN